MQWQPEEDDVAQLRKLLTFFLKILATMTSFFESSEDDDLDELFTVEDLQDDAERAYFEEETAANDFDLDEEPSKSS